MDVMDLTATPVLQEVIDGRLDETDSCVLRDVVVLNVNDIRFTIICDCKRFRLKSFYNVNGKQESSSLELDNYPWSIAVLNGGELKVTVPRARQIVTVNVNPELELCSTITTDKEYWGLGAIEQSSLVASARWPASVDILDMEGRLLRSLIQLPEPLSTFNCPRFIHVTRQGTILVSDYGHHSIIGMTHMGEVLFTYTPTGDRKLKHPVGVTSSSAGDILVADSSLHKVVHLSGSGEFIKDVLTKEDGFFYPYGMCAVGDKLYVLNECDGVNVYQFKK